MNCLKNIERITYTKELVYNLSKLYTYRGKDFHYEDVFKQHMQGIIRRTIAKDTIYAAKILNLEISEARMKYIAHKDAEPRNKDEIVMCSIGGMPLEDLSWGYDCYQRALEMGIGQSLNLWHEPYMK